MRVTELWRYPVKSMQGDRLAAADVVNNAITGDRSHALRDDASGVVLTARRDPKLLFATGVISDDSIGRVRMPDGTESNDDDELSRWIGRPVTFVEPNDAPSTYEIPVDAEDDDSEILTWQGPSGSYHDSTRTQISIVATGDLGRWDVRRFRPNVVIDADTADDLLGRRVRIGEVELDVVKQIDRCVMVARPQPDGIDRDLDVLRGIRRDRNMLLGVGSMVTCPGTISVGDPVEIL